MSSTLTATFDPATTKSVSLSIDMQVGTASIDVVPVGKKPAAPLPGLFSAQSPWNLIPVTPVLGKEVVPAVKQKPWIEEAAYASKIFIAEAGDAPVTVRAKQIANALEGADVLIPRFPADTLPATGADGHCEIVDGDDLHSFFGLRKPASQWVCDKYAYSSVSGSGWGTVANPDNSRAAGCSTAGGLLLKSERGMKVVPHALAIGLDKNGIKAGPVWPATLEDYAGGYSGPFQIGALLMLPASFDAEALALEESRTIARTLKLYGGRVVDATQDTMNIFAEIGSGWNQSYVNGKYSQVFDPDMQAIKAALRSVASVTGWKDRDGKAFTPTPPRFQNLLSMRGPWKAYPGSKMFGCYDARSDLYQCEATTEALAIQQSLWTHDETDKFGWQKSCWNLNPEPGATYIVRAIGEGGITAKIQVKKSDYRQTDIATDKLAPGASVKIVWPKDAGAVTEVYIDKGVGPAARIRLELIRA
jgi:hypothetical protein